jgi:hypothetical protein
MEPQGFSADLNAYLKKVLADNGREDRSGRWLEEVTGFVRSYDYWSKIAKDSRAMTTNDIDVLAKAFGITAFEWVDRTQQYAKGEDVPALVLNVGDPVQDGDTLTAEQEQALRKSDHELAAYRGENDAEIPHAE